MQLARLLPQIRQSGIDVSLFTISRGAPIESKLVQGRHLRGMGLKLRVGERSARCAQGLNCDARFGA